MFNWISCKWRALKADVARKWQATKLWFSAAILEAKLLYEDVISYIRRQRFLTLCERLAYFFLAMAVLSLVFSIGNTFILFALSLFLWLVSNANAMLRFRIRKLFT